MNVPPPLAKRRGRITAPFRNGATEGVHRDGAEIGWHPIGT